MRSPRRSRATSHPQSSRHRARRILGAEALSHRAQGVAQAGVLWGSRGCGVQGVGRASGGVWARSWVCARGSG
ncbi:hypothetical protein RIDGECB_94 [Mycobacterium phage RidgeCB]|uniref:Uncharacterized protein n=1 Tax=Mycobacterium phage RidgeCB TaxID=1071506 RepID=G1JTZ4_9CAUD|nr:hypothetical protein RIDGECB_94 [Mycobacterium phage RidgeCB]AEL20194.1 hypothetical protein RIDGECB_94 [Mycobacterium phage RidgeCB]